MENVVGAKIMYEKTADKKCSLAAIDYKLWITNFYLLEIPIKKVSLTCGNKHFGGIFGGMCKITYLTNTIIIIT